MALNKSVMMSDTGGSAKKQKIGGVLTTKPKDELENTVKSKFGESATIKTGSAIDGNTAPKGTGLKKIEPEKVGGQNDKWDNVIDYTAEKVDQTPETPEYKQPEVTAPEPEVTPTEKPAGNMTGPDWYNEQMGNKVPVTTPEPAQTTSRFDKTPDVDALKQYVTVLTSRLNERKNGEKPADYGVPTASEDENDLKNPWEVLGNSVDSSDALDTWGNVLDNESALGNGYVNPVQGKQKDLGTYPAGTMQYLQDNGLPLSWLETPAGQAYLSGATLTTPQAAKESGPVYPATGTEASIRDALVPLWAQMDIETLPVLTEGLAGMSDNGLEFFNSLPEVVRNQIAPGFLQWAPEKQNEFLHNLDNVVDDLYGKYDSIGREKPEGNGPANRYLPDVTTSPEYQNAVEVLNRQGIYGDEADRQAKELVASIFNTKNDVSDWYNAEPDADILQELVETQDVANNYRDGTPQEQRYDARYPKTTEPEMVFPVDTGGTTAYNPEEYTAETPEQKRDRLERMNQEMLGNGSGTTPQREPDVSEPASSGGTLNNIIDFFFGNDYKYNEDGTVSKVNETPESKKDRLAKQTEEMIANGTINNMPETNGQTGIEDVLDNIMTGGSQPETDEEKRKRLENVNNYLAENGYTPEAYNNLEKRALLEDMNNYLSENGYTPENYDAYMSQAYSTSSPSSSSSSSGDVPKGSKTYDPSYGQGGQVVKAPYKEGGYTEEELMKMGNKAYGSAYGNNAYEGYYRAPDGRYYPVDQEKAAYYQRYGTYNGWDEGMRDYYNTFGTFYGYTPTWKSTGRNTGGGRSYSYSGGNRSSGYSYNNNYSGNNNGSYVQPELTNQTRQRINNIMRNWTF